MNVTLYKKTGQLTYSDGFSATTAYYYAHDTSGNSWSGQAGVALVKGNYLNQGKKLGIDLVNNPELAERNDIAARVLVRGMIDGDFTGKKLGDYITAETYDFWGARRMINGTDKADLIAGYAEHYLNALIAASEPIKQLVALNASDHGYA